MSTGDTERVDVRKLLWLAPVAAIASIVVNLLVRAIARGVLDDISDDFRPLEVGAVVTWSVIGSVAAAIVFVLVARVARRPIERYRTIAIVALILSLIPDVLLLITKPEGFEEITLGATVTLMLMHVVVAAICIGLYTTQTRET